MKRFRARDWRPWSGGRQLKCLIRYIVWQLTVLFGCCRFAFKSVVDVLRNETSN